MKTIKIHEEHIKTKDWIYTFKGYQILSKKPLGYGVYECEVDDE